jgi:hypothetical protein
MKHASGAAIAGDDEHRQHLLEMLRDTLAFQIEAVEASARREQRDQIAINYIPAPISAHLNARFSKVRYDVMPAVFGADIMYRFQYVEPERNGTVRDALLSRVLHGYRTRGKSWVPNAEEASRAVCEIEFLYGELDIFKLFRRAADDEGWFVSLAPSALNWSGGDRKKQRVLTGEVGDGVLTLTLHPAGTADGFSFREVAGELRTGETVVGRLRAELVRPRPGGDSGLQALYQACEPICDDLATLAYVMNRHARNTGDWGGWGPTLIFTDWQTASGQAPDIEAAMLSETVRVLRKTFIGLSTIAANVTPLAYDRFFPVGLGRLLGDVYLQSTAKRAAALNRIDGPMALTPSREQWNLSDSYKWADVLTEVPTFDVFGLGSC